LVINHALGLYSVVYDNGYCQAAWKPETEYSPARPNLFTETILTGPCVNDYVELDNDGTLTFRRGLSADSEVYGRGKLVHQTAALG
jgi:hypothetical protein